MTYKTYKINCPHCKVELTAYISARDTVLRCPNIVTPEKIKKDKGIDNWPYSGKCGKMFMFTDQSFNN